MSLAVGKIVRRLDKRIFSVARPAKTPYSITNRQYCKTEKADGKNPHFKEAGPSSPFNHKVSEWDKKLLVWSGRFKKGEDIPQDISAKTMSASRSKLRVKVAYFGMAILLVGFVSAVLIGKQPCMAWVPVEELLYPNEFSPPHPCQQRACYESCQPKNSNRWDPEDTALLWPLPFGTSYPPRTFKNIDHYGI
ncbi:protein FAM162A isoform X1 [Protobothrops mucrosquamatus]|uniref:protein FAM162A isoform X1 n=1 Tax=Protobothrops mucrosquamatus TaxID=103944 RepID=UPI000775A1C4|nr:protein FAM162A isoform X1 [Protobothrops mucrosquamatus]